DVVVKVQSNPEGKTGTDNVIRSTSGATATAEIRVPLKIKGVNITLTDTVDFDVSDMSFNNLGLLLNVRNSLPLGVKLQCTLLKKGTTQSLGDLFDTPVEIPAGNTTQVAGTTDESKVTSPSETHKLVEVKKDMAKKLEEAGSIIVRFTAASDNTNNTFVRISKTDCVSLKIGVSAGINVGDLKDKL
ncbi:MAG: hypothetical protein LBB31_03225, partial [Prevotellaceae bacterium]|nr:hypothetical protein [Prevotellaceae bacterium]